MGLPVCNDSFHLVVLIKMAAFYRPPFCNLLCGTEISCQSLCFLWSSFSTLFFFFGVRTENLSINLAVLGIAIKYNPTHLASTEFTILSPDTLCSSHNIKLLRQFLRWYSMYISKWCLMLGKFMPEFRSISKICDAWWHRFTFIASPSVIQISNNNHHICMYFIVLLSFALFASDTFATLIGSSEIYSCGNYPCPKTNAFLNPNTQECSHVLHNFHLSSTTDAQWVQLD